jgi:hypothetical protein
VLAPVDDDELVKVLNSDDPAPVVLGSWVVQPVEVALSEQRVDVLQALPDFGRLAEVGVVPVLVVSPVLD